MSRKLKAVALDISPYGGYGNVNKARLKHHSLLQDYQDLQKETDVIRARLEAVKQRKLELLAEVRFLRKRHKHLSTMSSKSPQVREIVPLVPLEPKMKLVARDRISKKKDASLRGLPPLPNSNQKGRVYVRKEASRGSAAAHLGCVQMQASRVGKEAVHHNVIPISDFNHRGRIHIQKDAAVLNSSPVIDLNQSERMQSGNESDAPLDLNQDFSLGGKAVTLCSRAPIFDLNEISTEEEDVQSNSAPLKLEELKKSLTRGGIEEQHNDLKVSVCRNAGEGTSRLGKRKISFQDTVALRV